MLLITTSKRKITQRSHKKQRKAEESVGNRVNDVLTKYSFSHQRFCCFIFVMTAQNANKDEVVNGV